MGEYSYILEQQGKTTSEKLAEFTAAIGWRDELATYRIAQDEYEMRAAAAAEQGISLLDEPPYTAEELAALDAESAAYYDAFAANYVATAAFSGSGSGTQSDPYIITNRAELEAMADDLTAYYQLGNNIDLGGSSSPWTPIGSNSSPFSGTLNGAGYTISNMYISGEPTINCGFFKRVTGANIKNIGIIDATIVSSVAVNGVLIGRIAGSTPTVISSVYTTGTISQDGVSTCGGIVAATETSFTIENCYSDVTINAPNVGGGILGANQGYELSNGYVQNCYALGDITITSSSPSSYSAAGIAWLDNYVVVENCVALMNAIDGAYSNRVSKLYSGNLANNYANAAMLVNGNTVSGGTTTNADGADVSASTYNTQAFWQNTLGWDFDTVWYWDDTEQLPKLRAFLYTPKFPLNVEIGSPQYTTVSQINYSDSTTASVQVTPLSPDTTPVRNSYYTFQSQDGQYWMTAYVGKWTNNGGIWTADIKWSSSNTDSLPAQSICWCIWAKEYYQSIIDRLSS